MVGGLDIEGITWLDMLRRKRRRGHGGDLQENESSSWRVLTRTWLFRGVGCFRIGVSYVMDCRLPTTHSITPYAVDQELLTAGLFFFFFFFAIQLFQ